VQALDAETQRQSSPKQGDFVYASGQHKLAVLYLMDTLCINHTDKPEQQLTPDLQQQLCRELDPYIAKFVERLATPCNCERVCSKT
jgi:hypothetical protein